MVVTVRPTLILGHFYARKVVMKSWSLLMTENVWKVFSLNVVENVNRNHYDGNADVLDERWIVKFKE